MKKTLLGLSTIAALSPAVASAEDFYVGVSVGATETDALDIFKVPGISVDDDDTGFKVFAGYRAHEYFAVEAFYADLGEATASDVVDSLEIESDTFGLSALGIIPVTENFELFGKVGFHAWDADLSSTFGSASDDGTDATYGIGATYIMGQISFRAEIERYELDDDVDVDMFSAGIAFNF